MVNVNRKYRISNEQIHNTSFGKQNNVQNDQEERIENIKNRCFFDFPIKAGCFLSESCVSIIRYICKSINSCIASFFQKGSEELQEENEPLLFSERRSDSASEDVFSIAPLKPIYAQKFFDKKEGAASSQYVVFNVLDPYVSRKCNRELLRIFIDDLDETQNFQEKELLFSEMKQKLSLRQSLDPDEEECYNQFCNFFLRKGNLNIVIQSMPENLKEVLSGIMDRDKAAIEENLESLSEELKEFIVGFSLLCSYFACQEDFLFKKSDPLQTENQGEVRFHNQQSRAQKAQRYQTAKERSIDIVRYIVDPTSRENFWQKLDEKSAPVPVFLFDQISIEEIGNVKQWLVQARGSLNKEKKRALLDYFTERYHSAIQGGEKEAFLGIIEEILLKGRTNLSFQEAAKQEGLDDLFVFN